MPALRITLTWFANGIPSAATQLGKGRDMATYVLVHGGGHGGWCYQRVARILRAAGHDVYTPTLTGLGERAHSRVRSHLSGSSRCTERRTHHNGKTT